AVVPRRQPAPVAPLLAVPRAAAEGTRRGHCYAGLRATGGASHAVAADELSRGGELGGGELSWGQRGAPRVPREQRFADGLDPDARHLVRDRAGRSGVPIEAKLIVDVLE